MDDRVEVDETIISKFVTENGKTVRVMVRLVKAEEEVWELSIEGERNQLATWTDWFPSSEVAMKVGLSAILKEGIDEFYSDPEFKYSL